MWTSANKINKNEIFLYDNKIYSCMQLPNLCLVDEMNAHIYQCM